MFRRGPLTFADDGQSGAVNDEVQAGARAGAPKREGEMLTASRERGVIGGREIDAQHPEDRGQEALGLTQRSVEDETERQGGFDGEIGILELPAPPADASRCPRGDRVRREPEGDVASPHEGSVVLGPVPDAIRCRVLRMHSRLHIEIMTRLRSRWSTCRPLLAHRAESAHQRPDVLLCTDAAAEGLNFQFCGALVNYDMPWNPMRVEQRIGRIDRLGQQHQTIQIVNLHYEDTVESDVYQALRTRIGLFESVVGRLQPILARMPRTISQAVLSGHHRDARERANVVDAIERETREHEGRGFDIDTMTESDIVMPTRAPSFVT